MSTNDTVPQHKPDVYGEASDIRVALGAIIEDARVARAGGPHLDLDRLGERLSDIDARVGEIIERGIIHHGDDEALGNAESVGSILGSMRLGEEPQALPSPDALFAARAITVHHDQHQRGWYAMRERRLDEAGWWPTYMLHEDGWEEWGRGRTARVFATEFEARAAAAHTPLPHEPPERFPARFALILVRDGEVIDEESDTVGVNITTHFEPGGLPRGKAVGGAHQIALDFLRLLGQDYLADKIEDSRRPKPGSDDPDQPRLIGDLNSAIAATLTGACDGDPGDEHGKGGGR